MERLRFLPAALETVVGLRSSWPHPVFDGAFLPQSREVNRQGFRASWRVNQFSSDISSRMEECAAGDCGALGQIAFGVTLIDPVDIYVQADRATKYAMLFVGLSFIAFFVFEVLRELRIHPIQYTLVGLALSVFYLLLISLSEHMQFGAAYAIAALSCIGLLAYYVQRVLQGWRGAGLFAAMIATLYLVLYVIIQAEDFALLGGAVLVFTVLGIVMVVTRDIDWYRLGASPAAQDSAPDT